MKARGALAILVCSMAVLALPAGAAAKPGYYVSQPAIFNTIDLHGSNGYAVHISGISRDLVWVLVEKGDTSAAYLWRGRVTESGFEARFGKFGRASVRLEPGSRADVEDREAGCKGKPAVNREGRFTGTIRFRGERGFTRMALPIAEDALYTAQTTERQPGLGVVRSASVRAAPETFAASALGTVPATAMVSPPAPFSGTAAYEETADGKGTWSGDLAVELPGRGTLPLADSSYRAELCRSLACACPIGSCFFFTVTAGVGVKAERLRRLAARAQR